MGLTGIARRTGFWTYILGEGTKGIGRPGHSEISWNGKAYRLDELARSKEKAVKEKSFFIPAQRVLTLSRDGCSGSTAVARAFLLGGDRECVIPARKPGRKEDRPGRAEISSQTTQPGRVVR